MTLEVRNAEVRRSGVGRTLGNLPFRHSDLWGGGEVQKRRTAAALTKIKK